MELEGFDQYSSMAYTGPAGPSCAWKQDLQDMPLLVPCSKTVCAWPMVPYGLNCACACKRDSQRMPLLGHDSKACLCMAHASLCTATNCACACTRYSRCMSLLGHDNKASVQGPCKSVQGQTHACKQGKTSLCMAMCLHASMPSCVWPSKSVHGHACARKQDNMCIAMQMSVLGPGGTPTGATAI